MAFTKKNGDAVSEVISVILIVAVTLVLAGVIAALIFGVGSNVPKSKIVDVSLARNDGTPATSTVTAVFHGGKDAASVTNISFLVGNIDKGGMCMTGTCQGIKVGCLTSFTPGIKPATVIVVGNFTDGTKQVLLQQSPNKGEELPLPPLPRTVRDAFASYGSSISQPGYRAAIGKERQFDLRFRSQDP